MDMRRVMSDCLLIGSLLGLLLLLPGYVAIVGFQYAHAVNVPRQPAELRIVQASMEEGRFRIAVGTATQKNQAFLTTPRFKWMNRLWPLRSPTRRAGWEFDCHQMVSTPSLTIFLVGFPIWLVAIPLAIVPVTTLRRKLLQKPEPPAGFDVI